MVQSKYIYWCISHQQYVETQARRMLERQKRCKIVKLNFTLLEDVDFNMFSTWMESEKFIQKPPFNRRGTLAE